MLNLFKNYSFTARLAGALFGLSLAISGASGLFYYYSIRNTTLQQMGDRLTELGRTGAYLFTAEDRQRIVNLRREIETARVPITNEDMFAKFHGHSICGRNMSRGEV